MAYLTTRETMTHAWLAAFDHLVHAHEREEFDLFVEITDPTPAHADPSVVRVLDRLLVARGCHPVETVASTIFPAGLAATSRDRAHLYRRYGEIVPRLHKLKGNSKGLYFERLIDYPLSVRSVGERVNQVETIIHDLQGQLGRRSLGQGPLGSAYEAQIFVPGKDRLPQGFPCMSSLSFQLDRRSGRDQLRLAATYRNQHYVRRALGNFIGLAHLQRFVCTAVDLEPGPLTIHAFHAEIESTLGKGASFGKRAATNLLAECQRAATPATLRARSA